MLIGDRLGPDGPTADIAERGGGQDTGLDAGADGDHHRIEVGRAELLERSRARTVGHGHVGQAIGPLVHQIGIGVDRHHFDAQFLEGRGERGPEPAEPDDEHGLRGRLVLFSQVVEPVAQR